MKAIQAQRTPRWLVLAIAVIVIANVITIGGTLANPAPYTQLPVPFPAIAVITFAGSWGLLLAYLLVRLLQRWQWAFRWLGPLLTAYALTQFLWQFIFSRSDYDRGRLPFQAVISLLALIPVWWTVWRRGWLNNN